MEIEDVFILLRLLRAFENILEFQNTQKKIGRGFKLVQNSSELHTYILLF